MEIKEIRTHHIPAQNGVDAIDVFIVWYGECKSQVTIRCWDQAWTAYWNAHWDQRVEKFIADNANTDYLVNNFARCKGDSMNMVRLKKIVKSIQKYLKNLEVA